jgi:tetratricopeptide (TPR) repeat protein
MKRVLLLLMLFCKAVFAQQTSPQIDQLIKQALAYEDQGDNVNAIKTNLEIFNLDNTNYMATNTMAGLFGKMGDFRSEIKWAQKTLAIKPDFAKGYVNLGNGYTGQQSFDKAAECYNQAAKLDPESPYPPYELGVLEETKGNMKQAVADYELSAKLDPDFEQAWFNLAAGYANLNQFDKASQQIEKYLRIHPDDKDAKEMYEHILTEKRKKGFEYPTIQHSGKTIQSFVPSGWKIKDKALGDLNGDKIADAAIVLEYNTIAEEVRADNHTIHSHPRILLVLFKNGDHYQLALQQNTFILREHEGSAMGEDPYGELIIEKGILTISTDLLREFTNYRFRYQNNNFYLIGAGDYGRGIGTKDDWELDFVAKKATNYYGGSNDDSGSTTKTKVTQRKITIPKLKKLSELKQPYNWKIFKNVII